MKNVQEIGVLIQLNESQLSISFVHCKTIIIYWSWSLICFTQKNHDESSFVLSGNSFFFWTNLCCHISGLDHTRCILLRLVIRATLLNILRFLQLLFRILDYLLKFYARKETKSSYLKNSKKSPTWPKMSNVMAQPACQHLNWDLSTIWTFSFQFSNFKLLNAILKSIEVSNFEINLEKQEINMQQICATPSSHDCK